ncbi:MAG TPA: hypothetical protein VGA45_13390, partial [Actinomycetota bacterium]
LDVAALALGVDGVEGKRRLARSRQPGEDDQRVPGEVEMDVLQVVFAGASDDEAIGGAQDVPSSTSWGSSNQPRSL